MTRTKARLRRLFVAASALAVVTALGPRATLAESRTEFLAGRLRSDDFRVRTNAALSLGQTDDDAAVSPLCGALGDPSDVVRQAAAGALTRLGRGAAVPCLQGRVRVEPSGAVKLQIQRAIEALQGGGGASAPADAPRVVANAKYYVAVSVTNQTSRASAEVESLVATAVRAKLDSLGGYQLAPDNEGPEQAKATLAKRRLKGFYLAVRVEKFDYTGGNLRVHVQVAVFSYPGKDLKGEVPAGVTQSGVRPGDKAAEDSLLQMAAGRAVEVFAQNFQ
jgi:hypothetical protein